MLAWVVLGVAFAMQMVFFGVHFAFGLGVFLSSRTESLWQFYLYFGILAGIGRGADRAHEKSLPVETAARAET